MNFRWLYWVIYCDHEGCTSFVNGEDVGPDAPLRKCEKYAREEGWKKQHGEWRCPEHQETKPVTNPEVSHAKD